jgi:4-coumarate--CoA ligase
MTKYDLRKFCSYIQRYKITMAYVVPPVLLQLAKSPIVADFDLSSLRMMSSGAAPLTRDLVNAVYQRLKIPIKQGYGLSETSPTTHSQPWSTWYQYAGSVGLLLANQTIKYMSPEGRELPVGATGELWIKGPNIFQGYLNNVEGTQNTLTKDGYFKTGDVGYQDEMGNLYITDRVKEVIKYKGFQVPPAELEGLLLNHSEVEDVAVIGVYKEDQATEVPMAFIVLAEGIKGDLAKAKEIVGWLDARVSNHKRLRGGIQWVEHVPKSASGKILRRVLKLRVQDEKDSRPKL